LNASKPADERVTAKTGCAIQPAADPGMSLTLPNGIVVEYAYDDDARLIS
jgi:hypothetical protein